MMSALLGKAGCISIAADLLSSLPPAGQESADRARYLSCDSDRELDREGERITLSVQPVTPILLGKGRNLISRTGEQVVTPDNAFLGSVAHSASRQSGPDGSAGRYAFAPLFPKEIGGLRMRLRCRPLAMVVFCLALGFLQVAGAVVSFSQADSQEKPAKIEELIKLLGDAEVQQWIASRGQAAPREAHQATEIPGARQAIADHVAAIRRHISALIEVLPGLPGEIAKAASRVTSELDGRGTIWMIVLFAVFVGAGLGAQWLFWIWTRRLRERIATARWDTVNERLIAIAARFSFGAGYVVAFALGSIGAFLAFRWPPLFGEILLGYLVAVLVYRMARVLLEFLLSPPQARTFGDLERFRVIPLSSAAAAFWTRRLSWAVGWFAFGWITISLLQLLGLPRPAQQLIAYVLGLGLLAIGLEALWRRPRQEVIGEPKEASKSPVRDWLTSLFFIALWVLWVSGATNLFWLLAVTVALPAAMSVTQIGVNNILRPPGAAQGIAEAPSVLAAIIERGARAVLIVVAVLVLGNAWGVEAQAFTTNDSLGMRAVRGVLGAVLVLLLADFVWHVAKTMIDRKLLDVSEPGEIGSEDARRRARVRTLLPILRNILMIIVAVLAVLMALSSMGIEIGPLIAGAGIVGVAVGFGAQTIVKDVISGIFYLLDDAFRVGEYIQGGSYMGTVESFSLRSIKLRHHRGPIYIVPFSELGAVQNMSRDWVIEKMTINVAYDTDIERARKIIKKIGLELAQDPEFAASTIEPLKMQGVAFGDFAMILSMKLKTRPGEQFGIKRRALLLIKQAFSESGIRIAIPTIEVAGGDAKTAAAHQLLDMKKSAQAI